MWYYYCVKAPLATSYHLTPMILIIVREFRRRVLMRGFGGSTSSCRRHYYLFMRNGGPIFKSFCIPEAGSTPAAIILLSSFFMSVIMSRALRLLFFTTLSNLINGSMIPCLTSHLPSLLDYSESHVS